MTICKAIGCHAPVSWGTDYCPSCVQDIEINGTNYPQLFPQFCQGEQDLDQSPQERLIHKTAEMDIFDVHHHFHLHDPSGSLHHASRLILLSGNHITGLEQRRAIAEARDALTRWLELNPEPLGFRHLP